MTYVQDRIGCDRRQYHRQIRQAQKSRDLFRWMVCQNLGIHTDQLRSAYKTITAHTIYVHGRYRHQAR